MNPKLRNIRLYGVLGATFGRVFRMEVDSPREAIRALCVVLPGFEAFLNNSKKRGLTYAIFSGKKNIGIEELEIDRGDEDIRIAPVIIGNKKGGLLQTIVGAVLVVVGAVVGVMTSWTGIGGAIGGAMVSAGIGLMAGGVIQMLSPQTPGLSSKQDADNQASYAFGSPTNTAAQGYPVPLLYGRRRIGGAIISAGIYVEDQQ